MKIKCHFAVVGLSNTYIIGDAKGGPAIMVDPSRFDITLLKMIEDNNYYIRAVLVTHNHENHVRGLLTMRKIYDFDIYAAEPDVMGFITKELSEENHIDCCGFTVEPIMIRGHSSDSLVYKIGNTLFTGDLMSAGRLGTTSNSWTKATMYKDLAEKINVLDENTMIFPGHGPPSTLKIERETNPSFKDLDEFTLEGGELEIHEEEFEI
jgi:hydroxyacylglutathione hydrolase